MAAEYKLQYSNKTQQFQYYKEEPHFIEKVIEFKTGSVKKIQTKEVLKAD